MKINFSIPDLSIYPTEISQNVKYNPGNFSYYRFPNEDLKLSLLKQLKLYSKTKTICYELLYKNSSGDLIDYCNVIGFNLYSDEEHTAMQLLIETVKSKRIIPINSSYLKEMQKSSFGTIVCEEE